MYEIKQAVQWTYFIQTIVLRYLRFITLIFKLTGKENSLVDFSHKADSQSFRLHFEFIYIFQ